MKEILKILPRIFVAGMMWLGVVGIVVYVDPVEIKDVIIPELYLPLLVSVGVAFWYSVVLLTKSVKFASALSMILMIAMVSVVMRWMNMMIGVALVGMVVLLGLTFVRKS